MFGKEVRETKGINLTKFQLIQTIFISIFCICHLIEMKFCEVSRDSFSNKSLVFQISIMKKKVLFLKKIYNSGRSP